ncbi:DUF6771 family protein [Novosphingobium percolationis]|uniref:DUF6771 family protein n=1 Tax=Novosphingobium percolationis TaxID=2871811 RepID=UPI002970015C|nr:DUF6771 family protein [Novosphingobium percolationis]
MGRSVRLWPWRVNSEHSAPCSFVPLMFQLIVTRIEERQIAEALLTAPGWARVGISDPTPWMREDAALELARAILNHAEPFSAPGEAAATIL